MTPVQLTAGICELIRDTEDFDKLADSAPTVQILSIKKVGQTQGAQQMDRYRVIVSDGEYFLQAMLATQINVLVENGQLIKNSIINVEKMTCNPVSEGKRYAFCDASFSLY